MNFVRRALIVWLCVATFTLQSSAQLLLLGVGSNGGSAAPDVPGAVLFTPESALGSVGASINANGGVDTPQFTMAFWMRGWMGSPTNATTTQGNISNYTNWLLDINTNLTAGAATSETVPGLDFVYDNVSGTFGTQRLNVNDATGGTNHSLIGVKNNFAAQFNATWHHYLWAGDMNFTQGNKRMALYVDGVKQSLTSMAEVGTIGAFNVALNNSAGWLLNGKTASGHVSGAFEYADFFLDTHTVGLLDSSSNLSNATVAKFYNSGPVYLGADGSAPFGTQPEIYLTGDKSTFATNLGNATTAFSLSNPVAASSATPRLWNAAFGPAGPPTDRPYFMWTAGEILTGQTSATTSLAASNRGNPIAVGDTLIFAVQLGDTSTAFDRAIQTPSGWTLLSTSTIAFPYHSTGTHPGNYAVFWRVADAGDVTAAGSDWSNAPVANWTANANSLRSASVLVYSYRGANATSPIQAADAQFNTSSTNAVAPAVTATSAPTTLLTLHMLWSNNLNFVPGSSEDLRFRYSQAAGGSQGNTAAADKALAATGTTGTVTATLSAAEVSVGVNIILTK